MRKITAALAALLLLAACGGEVEPEPTVTVTATATVTSEVAVETVVEVTTTVTAAPSTPAPEAGHSTEVLALRMVLAGQSAEDQEMVCGAFRDLGAEFVAGTLNRDLAASERFSVAAVEEAFTVHCADL